MLINNSKGELVPLSEYLAEQESDTMINELNEGSFVKKEDL